MTQKLKTSDLTRISMFTAILAICAWIIIPSTIPFTMQTFGIFLTMGVLGGKRGTLAVLSYLLLGLIGVPVFSGFTGGIGRLIGPTGGYIVGFLFTALVMWAMERLWGNYRWTLSLSMIIGLVICYAFGTAWFLFLSASSTGIVGVGTALTLCVLPYIIPDFIKMLLALILCKRLKRLS